MFVIGSHPQDNNLLFSVFGIFISKSEKLVIQSILKKNPQLVLKKNDRQLAYKLKGHTAFERT